jgi:hypothetical protein
VFKGGEDMNERIRELAEQAGCVQHEFIWVANNFDMERFSELVRQDERNLRRTKKEWSDYERAIAADEREACAQLCESIAKPEENIYYTAPLIDIAIAAIRGRTE